MLAKDFLVLPWIVFLPAIGALLAGLLGPRWGDRFAGGVANVAVFLAFGLSIYAMWFLLHDDPGMVYLWSLYNFLDTDFVKIDVAFRFDRLSAAMALMVTGVSAFIHLYSLGYMKGDRGFARYFSHLNMFVFFMLLLVLGSNLLVMFVGWEGVGLSSYLLIGFWYEDMSKAIAGKKAFLVNRVGDFGFLLGMLILLIYNHGSLDFFAMEQWAASGAPAVVNEMNMTLICLLLFFGACGKSAQIPLYVWLPDAMAGPTPVSALIHAATMVTAGVYMVARLSFLFIHAPVAMLVVAGVGAATAFYAATIGIAQRDIKKVLAYSTVSQLGYMFLAVGSGAHSAGMFHLTTHAFFKGCLFLAAGSVIHALHGEQDIFRMGGLGKKLPITHWTFLISMLAIAGIPPLSGFFSKDEILTSVFLAQTGFPVFYKLFWMLGLCAAFITAFYMMRLYWLTFRGETRLSPEAVSKMHESPWNMATALIVLAACAAVGGLLGLPGEINMFHHWLDPVVGAYGFEAADVSHALHYVLVGAGVLAGVAGLTVGWALYRKGLEAAPAALAARFKPLYTLVAGKYFIDELYDLVVVRPLKAFSTFCFRVVDVVMIDLLAVNGAAWSVKGLGVVPRVFHNGNIQRYLFAIAAGLLCLWLVL